MSILNSISIELEQKNHQKIKSPLFMVKQYDKPQIDVKFTYKGEPYVLPELSNITLYGLRSDDVRPMQKVTNLFTLDNSFTSKSGLMCIEFEIEVEGDIITSPTYVFTVTPRVKTEESFELGNISLLTKINTLAKELIAILDTCISTGNEVNTNLNDSIGTAVNKDSHLVSTISEAIKVDGELEQLYYEVKEFAKDFDPHLEIPKMRKDITALENRKTKVTIY